MNQLDWIEFAGRLREREAELTAKANATLIDGDQQIADRLFDSAKEYRNAAIDADEKGMLG